MFNSLYLVGFVIVALLTRAPGRRIVGALTGGLIAGIVALLIVALGEKALWWHQRITWRPYYLALFVLGLAMSGFVFLLSWRLVRRFGPHGFIAALMAVALIGPPRDYWYMSHFPEWGTYNWSVTTVLAVSATYVLLFIAGHGVMRLVAGPAGNDSLREKF